MFQSVFANGNYHLIFLFGLLFGCVSLQQVIDLDEKNQILTSTWWLDITWTNYWFKWNSTDYGGIKIIRIPPKHLWMPDLILYNSANENFDATYPVKVLVYSDGTMNQIPPGTVLLFLAS